jgi:hypothetical protein
MWRKMPRFGPEASPLLQAIVPLSIWLIKLEPDRLLINFMISTPKIVANLSSVCHAVCMTVGLMRRCQLMKEALSSWGTSNIGIQKKHISGVSMKVAALFSKLSTVTSLWSVNMAVSFLP